MPRRPHSTRSVTISPSTTSPPRFHCRGDGGDSPLAILAAADCATVTALVSACSSFVMYGSPDPIPGSPCCVAMTSLNNLADSGDNRRAVCRCVMDLIAAYSSKATAIATVPGFCGCAASMDVRVGAFSDPEGLEGLAHFLEHMLFYASEKYPLEDSYSTYISEHGGSTNAFTSSEHTNYYFDVNPDCFDEALDRKPEEFTVRCLENESGNWETLDVRPKERGLDTREELLRFYNENYSANLMHLVIYSKESLDKSESLVRSKFQEIRNTDRSCITFAGQPCDSESLQILVKAVPIKQGHKLRFVWPMTPGIRYYKEGPSRPIGVFNILNGWATSLSAGESDWTNEFSFFKVVIDLTEAGHEHFEDIVALLFKYIRLLQQSGPCQWIFDEFYPPNDWLVGSSLPSKFNPTQIQSALEELSPHSVRIFWESTKFEGVTDLTEPWYGTAYSVERLPGSTIEQWIERAPSEDLHLPVPNVFIPTDLSLKTVSEQRKLPTLLRKTQYSRLWYKPDTSFLTPKAYVKIDFNCPFSGSSPESEVLTEIFTRLLMDYLNEYAYDAQVAGLYYGVNNTDFGFQVTVLGYNHKLKILLDTVINQIANFEVKPERFAVIKELVTKEYQNLKFQQPYQQAMYYCSLVLQDQTWPWTDELEVLPHLKVEDLVKFYPLMLSRTFLECYTAGNLEPNEAESIIQHIEEVFFKGSNPSSQALFASQYMTNRIIKLERGVNSIYSAEGLNPSDENSALVHYIQVHQDDFKLNVKLQLFAMIAKQPAFHQLRSVEQLGYITVLMQRNDSGVRGVQFIIQSNAKGPGQIDLRVESFLKMFETKLYEMPSDEFKSNVNALIEMKLEKHKNLREESGFYWREISDGTLKFDRREREVEALKQLSQKELIDFFNEHIKFGATQKKSMSVRVYGSAHSSEYQTDNSQTAESNTVRIEDIYSFRRSRPLYGSFRGVFGHLKFIIKGAHVVWVDARAYRCRWFFKHFVVVEVAGERLLVVVVVGRRVVVQASSLRAVSQLAKVNKDWSTLYSMVMSFMVRVDLYAFFFF
ncbi:zinc-metallopeptidase peroxisomal [Phtheirospermum japonicum]|uniref:Zinc-metallopeptidase peroxisomal n=1 Tax=Phtheirospermum japonicum TaxID=374723 RepID=A0A830C543_9LAMI|nr:zinc-metallopeptidase peroxisomal [Phtheirospermum japonicum]